MEERFARERLIRYRGEDPMHARPRRRAADPRQQTEGTVGSARLLERREDQNYPFGTIPVVDERARSQLPAVILQKDPEPTVQTDQARQQTRPARDRAGGKGNGKRRRHDPAWIAERACEEGGDAA